MLLPLSIMEFGRGLSRMEAISKSARTPFVANDRKEVEISANANHSVSVENLVRVIMFKGLDASLRSKLIAGVEGINENHLDIIAVIFRSPFEKIIFEISKFFLAKKLPLLAVKYLQLVVSRSGCDWWAFYRSCHILREAFQIIGDKESAQHYQDLLSLSNENFPF